MKLILSSCDFINDNSKNVIIKNIDKNLEDCKILFIPNEKATPDKIKSDKYYDRLEKDGFTRKENIYIFDENNSKQYTNLDIDLIYIGGGNTFETIKKLRKCDFLNVIANYIKNGVTYIGGSCGAHIVTKNIKHVEMFDSNNICLTNYDGLGFLDGIIIPHYDESRQEIANKLINEGKYNVYLLTNNDSIIVTDDLIKVVKVNN